MDAPGAMQADGMEPAVNPTETTGEGFNNISPQKDSDDRTPEQREADRRRMKRNVLLFNVGLTSYFLLYTFLGIVVGMNVILPEVVVPELEFPARLLAWYIVIMDLCGHFGVWYFAKKSHYSPQSTDRLPTQNPATGGWWYCKSCDMNSPPRSRHCIMCRVCVLKRDHHCFFAASCIGYHNHRFFVVMCVYSFLGSLYSTVLTAAYLGPRYAFIISGECYAYLLPVLLYRWVTGQVELAIIGFYLYLCMSFVTWLGATFFVVWQIILIIRGQTPVERVKKVDTYRLSPMENVQQVFGPAGPLNLIFPLLFVQLPGDGISWNTSHSRVKAS